MVAIKHDPPCQRRHPRIVAPACVVLESRSYRTRDWSIGGFAIEDYRGPLTVGNVARIHFSLDFQGFSIGFGKTIRIVRRTEKGLGCQYEEELDGRERELLEYFVRCWVRADFTSIEDTIARLDRPVTAVLPSDGEGDSGSPPTRRRALLLTGIYVIIGATVTAFVALSVYDRLFRLDVRSAVVMRDLTAVDALFDGVIQAIHVAEGERVAAGQELFSILSHEVQRELDAAALELESATLALRSARRNVENEERKLEFSRLLARERKGLAVEEVRIRGEQLKVGLSALERQQGLSREGVASDSDLDVAIARYKEMEFAREAAESRLSIESTAVDALDAGFVYENDELKGDLPRLREALKAAEELVQLKERTLDLIRRRADTQVHVAPVAGRISRMVSRPGAAASRGDAVLMLEDESRPRVEAYLTQSEVDRLRIGERVAVLVHGIDRRFAGRIQSIDRRSSMDLTTHRFAWSGREDREALVVLTLEDLGREASSQLTTGLPAWLSVPTSLKADVASLLSRYRE